MSILTTSMPIVIDGLLALIRGLDLTYNGDPVAVFDGFAGPQVPDVFVQLGGVEADTASGAQTWASLGSAPMTAPARDETYEINCYVSAYVGGVDASTTDPSDAQKTARDAAFAVVSEIETGVREDPKLVNELGGNGIGTGWLSFGGRVELDQTTLDDPEAGKGRRAVVHFQIGVYRRLYSN